MFNVEWVEWNKKDNAILYKLETKGEPLATKCVGIVNCNVRKVSIEFSKLY